MPYSPTKVNPFSAFQANYEYMYPPKLLLPDGEYILKWDFNRSGKSPVFYLFNSDEKFTGYWMYLEIFDKKNQLIELNFTKDLQYIVNSLNGKESVKVKKGQKAVIDRFHILRSFYSNKKQEQVLIERYPIYQSPDQSVAKTTGTIVDQDSNKPIKGSTVEETD
jgi:hypothetical protein